ncbi:hypothetical protein [Corynebacterium terpenotabidum]|uniref:Methionine synthase n=1 Tax=Corynebacterium terpenotabidum Y-11 TaxID=1200352 RepID=S4XD79_9CORY|nr:hypothetical protein [Corynebacterium terpenotabidum]AGP31107.1 hypothetical protein A606_07300 [Corynebacterium terpenotabidum Y-11]
MTRYAWWEDLVTDHRDLRAALAAASRRTRDVDEDVGELPPLSVPRSAVDGGPLVETAAMGVLVGGPYLRSHSRGWEIAPGKTLDMRAFLGRQHELTDIIAETMPGADRLMVHVVGPWTFGASVEYKGHPLCFDRPAFRDVALALGEGIREFCDAVGASVVHVHERRLPEITTRLEGATEFETMSVDREIAVNVERRFIGQVCEGPDREAVLDAGAVWPELTLTGATSLVVDELTDDVARVIDGGASVAWRVHGGSSDEVARRVIRTWRQWTFDAATPEPQIDLVAVGDGVLTPGAAAELARTVRGAAELLHRN